MTYRIKTWANNVPALELEIFAFLKLCDPHMSPDPPLLVFPLLKSYIFLFLYLLLWKMGKIM